MRGPEAVAHQTDEPKFVRKLNSAGLKRMSNKEACEFGVTIGRLDGAVALTSPRDTCVKPLPFYGRLQFANASRSAS